MNLLLSIVIKAFQVWLLIFAVASLGYCIDHYIFLNSLELSLEYFLVIFGKGFGVVACIGLIALLGKLIHARKR